MSESEGTLVLVALFSLRCIMPLAITLAFGYFMNRLVDRWQAEDRVGERADEKAEPSLSSEVKSRLPVLTIPCWVLNNCDELAKEDCAAYNHPGLPCWLARLRSDGALPEKCPDCPIYARAMVPAH